MCFLELSDSTGVIEAVVFPDIFAISGAKLSEGSVLLISGKISVKDDRISVICGAITSESEFEHIVSNMKLCIKTTSDKAYIPNELIRLCSDYRGTTAICFYLTDARKTVTPKNKLMLKVDVNSAERLKDLYNSSEIGLIQ